MAEAGGTPALRRFWTADVRRRTGLAVLVAGWLLAVGWLVVPAVVVSEDTRDARDVFCLQADERDALADAAVALGLARPDSTPERLLVDDGPVTAYEWRGEHNEDFVRACDALSSVRGKATATGGGATGFVAPLLTVVLTSALTYATTRRQNRTTRGEADADELRAAVTAYVNATNEFLDTRIPYPADDPTTAMDAAREAVIGRLNGIAERKPAWVAVRSVVALLREGELGASMDQELGDMADATARMRRLTELRARVTEVSVIGYLVADALAEHGRVDRRLTRPLAEGAPT